MKKKTEKEPIEEEHEEKAEVEVPVIIEGADVLDEVPETPEELEKVAPGAVRVVDKDSWKPKTGLGRVVKAGEITDIDQLIESGKPIMEAEIVDVLLPNISSDLLLIGQSKGKFGGGQRRVFRQTQKKTREGNKPKFATCAVVGDQNGHVGLGHGKSKETVPARESALRDAKQKIIKIRRGCGSWECGCHSSHSIPFRVEGKCGSAKIVLMPAPRGTGLIVQKECAKILQLAGIKDVWSTTFGQTRTRINLVEACFSALKQLQTTKIKHSDLKKLGIDAEHTEG